MHATPPGSRRLPSASAVSGGQATSTTTGSATTSTTQSKPWRVKRQNELTGEWEELTVIAIDEDERVIILESW
jgi:hypothetical protein